MDPLEPEALVERLRFSLPEGEAKGEGKGQEGEGEGEGPKDRLLRLVRDVLRYSVNTWDQGFLDKLYSSTNPVREISPTAPPFFPASAATGTCDGAGVHRRTRLFWERGQEEELLA